MSTASEYVRSVMERLHTFLTENIPTFRLPSVPDLVFELKQNEEYDTNDHFFMYFDDRCVAIAVQFIYLESVSKYMVEINLVSLRYSKRDRPCGRSGNQYLAIIDFVNEHFFSNRDNFDGKVCRVIFYVGIDASHIPGLRNFVVTKRMVEQTEWIRDQKAATPKNPLPSASFQEMLSPSRERDHDVTNVGRVKLKDAIRNFGELKRTPLLLTLFNDMLSSAYSTIENGEIYIHALARLVLDKFHMPLLHQNSLDKYIIRLWFEFILPRLTTYYPQTFIDNDEFDTLYSSPLKLRYLTLLGRDDCKTWYMDKLKLNMCGLRGLPREYYAQHVRDIQQMTFKQAVGMLERTDIFIPPRYKDVTIKEYVIILSNKSRTRQFDFLDELMYDIVEQVAQIKFENDVFTSQFCRVLIQETEGGCINPMSVMRPSFNQINPDDEISIRQYIKRANGIQEAT